MFLSKLELNLQSKEVRRDVGNFYEMHRTLSRAYAVDDSSKPLRFLWRLEAVRDYQLPVILVQSSVEPKWKVLPRNYCQSTPLVKSIDLQRILDRQHFYFRLLANPTVCRQGKRYGLIHEEEQLEWLDRQGLKHGFRVQLASIQHSNMLQIKRDTKSIGVFGVLYDGALEVIDKDALHNALINGIGPAKSFGCGLLSIGKM